MVPMIVNGIPYTFELDTGSTVTIMSEGECKKLFPPGTMMRKSTLLLKTYSGKCLPVLGELEADVEYGQQKHQLCLIVVDGDGPSLLGQDWQLSPIMKWEAWNVFLIDMVTYSMMNWEQ